VVGTGFVQPREAITHHEVVAARVGRPVRQNRNTLVRMIPRPGFIAASFFVSALIGSAQTSPSQGSATRYENCAVTTHDQADCTFDSVLFNAPSAPDGLTSQAAHRTNLTVYGPGVSLGNAGGWTVHKLYVDSMDVASRGIAQADSLVFTKHAVGDTMGAYRYIFSDGGSTALSDEAIKGDAMNMGETSGYFHGAVSSTIGPGDIAPKLSFTSGNNWTTDGAPLLDISAGTISGHLTGKSAPLPGSGYLNVLPVDNALPLTTAWGVYDEPIPFRKKLQTNTPFTCTVTLRAGRFHPGGEVCVTGPNYPEQAPITAVGEVSGDRQSIRIAVRYPNAKGATILQGGICGQYLSFDANLAATGYRSSYYAFGALDPHHLIYGMNMRGGLAGNILPIAGSEAEAPGVPGRDGYHLYPGCEVVTNQSLAANPICEPNSVPWHISDLVEAPHNVAVNVVGSYMDVAQNTPSNGSLSAGDILTFHGMGTVGRTFIGHRTINGNPYTLFKPFGGLFEAPDLNRIEGYFANGLAFNAAPGAVIRINGNADRSNAPMTLFALPNGEIDWDPTTASLEVNHININHPAVAKKLRGTTAIIGGKPLPLGACATGTAIIPGATSTMIPVTVAATTGAPGFSPSGGFQVTAQVTAPNTVTVSICAVLAGTPKPSTYLVALE
jgi:hypothetical protein